MNDINSKNGYYLAPPDGGWGIVIMLVVTVTSLCTFMPIVTFGIIFESFMESVGDKAGGTALIIGVYFAVQWTTGLAANILLQKTSYRKVGIIGAITTFLGLFAATFVTNLFQLILSFSVAQGFGYGLMLPAVLTAFNLYFDKRKAIAFNFANTLVILTTTSFPSFASFLINNLGYRGANIIQAAICLNCIPAVLCLQPVKWHMKKQKILDIELIEEKRCFEKNQEILEQKVKFLDNENQATEITSDLIKNSKCEERDAKMHVSLWKSIAKSLDLGLFTDPVYVNIVIGASLCISADYTFLSVLPVLLNDTNITPTELTTILTIFYIGDIIGRLSLMAVIAFTKMTNRSLLLLGAILLAIFRTGFVLYDSFWWLALCSALMGSLRCLFQTTHPLIFTELYTKRFITAFSLFMIVCGIISLLSGLLINVIKNITQSNQIVAHSLTVMNLLCAIPWLLELLYYRIKRNKS